MSPRVLWIEGDEAIRARVRGLLESQGFAVDSAATGVEGMDRAHALPPDLVLADAHLPDIDATELAARLRRDRVLARVPFVAVNARPEEHDAALAAGWDGVLDAPLEDGLVGDVRSFLAGRREPLGGDAEREGLRELSSSLASRLEAARDDARRAEARLSELVRLRGAFVHDLAHELSTPLTPIAGYLRILKAGKLGPLSEQQRKIVDAMIQSVGRLARIVDNLADFANLQEGRAPLNEGPVDPDALADAVVAELAGAARDARLHVVVQRAGGGPVLADARKLRQALANVVSNAVKFSPHGGEVLVEVQREPGRLRFAVYDQGPGVPAGEAEGIFEPLHHAGARAGEEARAPGSGLGLPVARRIAEAHGGRAFVESPPRTQPGSAARHYGGAKFVLEIPARPAERVSAGADGQAAGGATAS